MREKKERSWKRELGEEERSYLIKWVVGSGLANKLASLVYIEELFTCICPVKGVRVTVSNHVSI